MTHVQRQNLTTHAVSAHGVVEALPGVAGAVVVAIHGAVGLGGRDPGVVVLVVVLGGDGREVGEGGLGLLLLGRRKLDQVREGDLVALQLESGKRMLMYA